MVGRESERTTSGQVVCWDLGAATIHEVSTDSDFLPPRLDTERSVNQRLPSSLFLPSSVDLSHHTASGLETDLLKHPSSNLRMS